MSMTVAKAQPKAPQAEIRLSKGKNILFLSGCWSIRTLKFAAGQAEILKKLPTPQQIEAVDLQAVSELDTSGAMIINKLRLLRPGGISGACLLPLLGAKQNQLDILDLCLPSANANPGPTSPAAVNSVSFPQARLNSGSPWYTQFSRPLHHLGEAVFGLVLKSGERLSFFGQFLFTLGKNIIHPRDVRWISIICHMGQAGVGSIPIVALLSFLIGMVLSYMAATLMAGFGAQIFVVNLLEVAILREMGVLLTAILIAGRSGSSYTAQIGAMVAGQEIDAMRSMGLDPMHMLVVPRVAALLVMFPLLVVIADFSGLLGGLAAVWFSLDITPVMFMEALQRSIHLQNFVIGLVKAPFFALLIGCIGCFDGFKVTGSADSVGRMTTQAVVESIFMVITLDACFALFFTSIGI